MFHPLKPNSRFSNSRFSRLLILSLLAVPVVAIATPLYTSAHEVETSGDVGGTMHIEPNDSPRAGTASLAWFALTRRGGQEIPLSTCNCQLAVYAQPRHQGDAPVAQPSLTATSIEGRQGVPGTNITFPRVGAYELVLQGRPVSSGTFSPFELRFPVTVAQ